MISYIVLTLLISAFGWHQFRIQPSFVNVGVFFNAYAILYFVWGIAYFSLTYQQGVIEAELLAITHMAMAAVVGFNMASYIRSPFSVAQGFWNKYSPSLSAIFLFMLFGLAVEIVSLLLIGPAEYFFSDRVDRFGIKKQYNYLLYFKTYLYICLPLLMYKYFIEENRQARNLIFMLLFHNMLIAIITISRSDLVFNCLCLLYFLDSKYKFNKYLLILGCCFFAVSLFYFKGILYGVVLNKEYAEFNPGEFINWIRNSIIVLVDKVSWRELPNISYALTVKALFIASPNDIALSEWFIRAYFPERASSGLTYGFSGPLEGYLYLGFVGTFIHFLLLGILFRWLTSGNGILPTVCMLIMIFLMYRIFRSEAYNFIKTFTWYYFYPLLLIVFFDSTIIRKIRSLRVL
jgi:hypothetical protein